ncbi:S10 family peptidase [Sediminicola luteus]|uniref:Peptidase S10 n=1 Tax=Sediminicola luteus TaxID=319238 RepID=A0A2A4G8M9_9FLAO|nr:peptidase S10 [Sediminicola luteus]PCE64346.1 peptidase S10 [Sediminicola luteus]
MKKIVFLAVLFTCVLWSQDKKEVVKPIPEPKSFVTSHQITAGGKLIKYKAIAGETYLKNAKGEATAAMWSVSYIKEGADSRRPVTFVFNGGPGSASVWLHMGLFGPKLVKVDSDAKQDDGAAPFAVVANSKSLMDLTDLVFIDPVGTGYSQVIGKGKEKDFWGLNEDAASVAQFIRLWITQYKRWNAPKYMAGESFGTTRAAAVTQALEGSGQNVAMNGLILISQALDYDGSTSIPNNITSYLTYLPSMAATAWYHKKAGQGKSLEAFVQESRDFTYNEYAPALYKGALLTTSERETLAQKLAYFTGLDKAYIHRSDLRVLMPRFQKKLLEDQGMAIGRLDGRFMGDEIDDVADRPTLGDPSSYQIGAAYTAALNQYLLHDLKVDMDRPYLTSNGQIGQKWRWRTRPDGSYWEPTPVNVSDRLGETMRRNTQMKVLVASGYYDLITPFFDAEYTFNRNGIVKERVSMTYYEGGHMMYTHEPDFIKLADDIRMFLEK